MASQVTITKFDSATKRYIAQLTVTEGETARTYTCEGQWKDGAEKQVASMLWGNHVAVTAKAAGPDSEQKAIEDKITAEIAKLEA
jgi:hypothetical protein